MIVHLNIVPTIHRTVSRYFKQRLIYRHIGAENEQTSVISIVIHAYNSDRPIGDEKEKEKEKENV
jgi:hypothetical protein